MLNHLFSLVRRYSAAAPQNQLKRLASSLRPYTQPTQKMPFCGSRNVVASSAKGIDTLHSVLMCMAVEVGPQLATQPGLTMPVLRTSTGNTVAASVGEHRDMWSKSWGSCCLEDMPSTLL